MPLILLGLASFVAWFVSMLAGGGSPLILIPLMNLLFSPAAVAPAITVGMLVGSSQRSLFFWNDIDWQVTAWSVPGAIAGSLLGAYALTQIRADGLQLVLAVGLLIMVVQYWRNQTTLPFALATWHFLPLTFLNAVGSGLLGSTGPLLNPFYLHYGLTKEPMIATKSINVILIHVTKLIAYAAFGMLTWQSGLCGFVIGLASIPANWLGKQVLASMSSDQFHHLVFTFVAISALFMGWGQRDLLATFTHHAIASVHALVTVYLS